MASNVWRASGAFAPGVAITGAVGLAAWGSARALATAYPHAAVDAVVIAILGGILLRGWWAPGKRTAPGISLAAKQMLEVAIVLLGLSTDLRWMARAGGTLAASIAAVTAMALGAGLLWGRLFGLPRSHALLVASGNAICGNSAIAAVASVIGAKHEETASAVAYTAVLSLVLVLALPVVRQFLVLSDMRYGVLTGLTVYAVPQVLAAAYPVSVQAGQVGTIVKLVRVLMLIPLVLALSLRRHRAQVPDGSAVSLFSVLPWYVVGFLGAAIVRSSGALSDHWATAAQMASHWLTILSMAALGLGVELELLRRVGWRTAATATLSLLTLCGLAGTLVAWMPNV